MTDNTYPRYARRTPAPVEAYQWLPEDAQHTQEVLAWLMHYPKTRFIVEPSSDAVFGTKQTVGFQHNGAGWDEYAWPGDWIVRNGPNSYSVYDDADFHAFFGEGQVTNDDSG